jgi:EmrB/QacA subfamily drug resistance transporter
MSKQDVVKQYASMKTDSHPSAVLIMTILASSLAFVDGSVVNVALPAMAKTFSANAASLQWIIDIYLLPLSALLLLGGAAGDHFGRRRLLVLGTLLFALASIGCSFASSVPVILAFRLAQGVGAAMLMPNSLAILSQEFSGTAKGRAVGIWAASGAAFGAIGPVLGGWLIDLGSWRSIFLINVPLAAAAILLALRYIPRDRETGSGKLDAFGGLLATLGLAGLTWGLTMGSGRGGWSISAALLGIAGMTTLAWFIWTEARRGKTAMMPLTLFASQSFVGLTLFTLLLYGALGVVFVLVPFVLIQAAGYTGTGAGSALLPLPLVIAVGSPLIGPIAARVGARLPLSLGSLLVAIGFCMAWRVDAIANFWTEVLPMMLLIAVGMAIAVAPLTTAVLASVDNEHVGSASGFNSAVARIGGLLGTALLGSVFAGQGAQLLNAFHAAMLYSALACVLASVVAFTLIKPAR